MRTAATIFLATLLGGCNLVTSTTPLFSARDAQGQAQLRPGIWMNVDASCTVDAAKPLADWPKCANAWVVRPGEVMAGRDPGAAPATWVSYKFVLARGDPAVMQVGFSDDKAQLVYVYAGLRPLKYDARGRVIEYKGWLAQCGPPPPPDPTGQQNGVTTRQPIEGLVLDAKGQDCVASAQGPVRVSVRESEAWEDASDHSHDLARWVRDGEQ